MPADRWNGFDGITVTVPFDSAPHRLFDLLVAVAPNVAVRARFISIQSDPVQAGTSDCFIGSAATDSQGSNNPGKLTATNYGYRLQKAGVRTFIGFKDEDFPVGRLYVWAATAAVQLNVEIDRG